MKYSDFKESLRQSDPELDSRVKAEKLRVDLAVAIARKREDFDASIDAFII
jgi:hypothetical protein